MWFHTLYFRLKGTATNVIEWNPLEHDERELDIADEFIISGCAAGFAGDYRLGFQPTDAGFWRVGLVDDEYTMIAGDFLARGLNLDLICRVEYPLPFSEIFLCLDKTLRRLAYCEITELTLDCKPYSVRSRGKWQWPRGSVQQFIEMERESKRNPPPVVKCSEINFVCSNNHSFEGEQDSIIFSGTVPLEDPPSSLVDLSLPFSVIWSYWEPRDLRNVKTFQSTAR